MVIHDIIASANQGFPPNHCRIKEHVDEILQSHLGDAFPESGVGKDWTKHFISDHNDQIRPYWSKGLDHSRARAVNPTTKRHYYELLTMVIEGKGGNDIIPPELIFGVDESGFQKGMGKKERVFEPQGKQCQHQQRSGD
ncbi:hypothetical protein BJV74DRAFT_771898 [Russula compacta]|nr:hypothetical protein BJV74DRAFT_771898 [Russula compacta]